jgi:hypothetical protein
MQARAQVADALFPPPAEESAERHHSVASDVLTELRVEVKWPVGDGLNALSNAPNCVKAGHVYIEEGDDLQTPNQSGEDTHAAQCQLQCTTGIHTMRMLGVVSERNSASLPISHARIIQPTTESFEAVASAPPTE